MALTTTQINHWFIATQGIAATGLTATSLASTNLNGLVSLASFSTGWNKADEDFIESLYVEILGRASDEEGKAWWLETLANSTRDEVANSFVYSALKSENPADVSAAAASNSAYITGLYQVLFGRNPDDAGLAFWMDELANGVSRADMTKSLITGAQGGDQTVLYNITQQKVLMILYHLTGAYDMDGVEYWTAVTIANGLTDSELVSAIVSGATMEDRKTINNKTAFADAYSEATPALEQKEGLNNSTAAINDKTPNAAELGADYGTADAGGEPVPPLAQDVTIGFTGITGMAYATNIANANLKYDRAADPNSYADKANALNVYYNQNTKAVSFDESIRSLTSVSAVRIIGINDSDLQIDGTNLSRLAALTSIDKMTGNAKLTLNKADKLTDVALSGGNDELVITGRTDALKSINLGGGEAGDDVLTIQAGGRISEKATIDMNYGNDTVTIQKGASALSANIDLGAGDDVLAIDAANIKNASINFGIGTDELVLDSDNYALSGASITNSGALTVVTGADGTTITDFGNSNGLESGSGVAMKFDVKGDLTLKLSKSDATSVDISKISGSLDAGDDTITLDVAAASGSLATVKGTTDQNITDILDLGSANYSSLSSIKEIDVIKANGATVSSSAIKDIEVKLDGELNISGSVSSSLDLTKLSAFDGDGDVLNLTVVSGATLKLNADDEIVENIKLESLSSASVANITGAAAGDKIDLSGLASKGWKDAKSLESSTATKVTLDKLANDLNSKGVTAFGLDSSVSGGYVVADVNDGIAIYQVESSSSVKLIAQIGSADDNVNVGTQTITDVSFTIA